MKVIKYNLCTIINHGTEEEPKIEEILSPVTMVWNEVNEEIAKKEAYNGEYTIGDDGQSSYPVASHNILEGEYVTIDSTLYLATQNIPSGEPVIAGQNAVATTVEEQLLMMKGE